MVNKNDILTLDDNKDYCVADTFKLDGNDYVFLFDVNEPTNVLYTKMNNDELVVVDDPEELKKFLDILSENI